MGKLWVVAIAQIGHGYPGDMYVPVEAFDFIPLMQKQANQNKGKLMPGTYEIRLEMKPSEVKSEPIYTTLSFKIG